ncbi:MAG TPA: hypothetical protein DIV41_08275 [Ruminococcaceae bacterium]|nr:hypothetical protein [Oscillospiraceae bacterium]
MEYKNKKYRFGVNMADFCRKHEAYIESEAGSGKDAGKLLSYHMAKLSWLQHERLVHLIVTMFTALFLTAFLILLHFMPGLPAALAVIILTVLLVFYFIHYFRLENTVQRWYIIAGELYEKSGAGRG